MKSSSILTLLIFLFSFVVSAQTLDPKGVEQVLRDADQGNPKAQAYLGGMYYSGNGVSLNHSEAVKWYRKAAEQGEVRGQIGLGVMFYHGKGVVLDYAKATKWFSKAAEHGGDDAAKWLKAARYAQKRSEDVKRYRAAAEQGDAGMQVKIGTIYRYGRSGVTKDRAEAMRWYRMAVDQGYSPGAYELGEMLSYGNRTAQDHVDAVKWYRKAADLGSAAGLKKLGEMYRTGKGVGKDLEEAKKSTASE